MSLKPVVGKVQNRSSLLVCFVKPGKGREGRGRRLSPLPRPALEKRALLVDGDGLDIEPDALEDAELGLLHLLGSLGVAALQRLRTKESLGGSGLEILLPVLQ
jgi:hypothetical protein